MRMDDKRTPKRILEWKPIGTGIGGRPGKRWIVEIEEGMEKRQWRNNVKQEQNGRESLRRLKPKVGCNASNRRRYNDHTIYSETCLNRTPLYTGNLDKRKINFGTELFPM